MSVEVESVILPNKPLSNLEIVEASKKIENTKL